MPLACSGIAKSLPLTDVIDQSLALSALSPGLSASTSVTVNDPLSLGSPATPVPASVTSLSGVPAATAITGASLLPVMLIFSALLAVLPATPLVS